VTTPLPRSEFDVTERYTYLNHAAVGVLPRTTRDAVRAFIDGQAQGGVMGTYTYEAQMPAYRERVGAFIGARGSDIAILRNTGDGANVAALGIDWRPGDEVVLPDNEFPSNAIPWLALRRLGVNVRLVPTAQTRLTPDALRAAMTSRTRAVAVSWVSFADGYRHDLSALSDVAHAGGALFCVDVMQALGAFPLDVRACNIDVAYGSGAKWLLALQGVSFAYVSPETLDRLTLGAPGWRSAADMWDFLNYDQGYVGDATRFEGGTPNFVGALSLDRSIELLAVAKPERIAAHVLALTDRLVEGLKRLGATVLSPRGDGISSGIVTFSMPGAESVALGRAIQREGVITTWRSNGIRVAPHGYNTDADIDRLLAIVPDCVRLTHT